ncbi:MAG: ATP-binding protein [Cypionkella sp.]|jgi:hypothetical protein|nr:ATP-binding protein [Cypionkella sp.]
MIGEDHMLDMHLDRVTIETRAHSILKEVAGQVIATAGLGIIRGPVGIGKSFALETIRRDLEANGDRVLFLTSSPEVEGSIGSFARAMLAPYGISGGVASSAVESLADLVLSGSPFRGFGERVLVIIDEGQGLKTNILEMLRGLWDRGDAARLGDTFAPAFGLLLVGNDSFFNKGGRTKKAEFRPLMSRVTHDLELPRPDRAEYADLARCLLPEAEELRPMLEAFGHESGNLRAVAKAHRQAVALAGNSPVTAEHLRRAIMFCGGRK